MQKYLLVFENFKISNLIDLIIITFIVYYIYRGLAKTQVLPILQTFLLILFVTFLSAIFELKTINYILEYVVSLMLVASIILFPAEIKKLLYRFGGRTLLSRFISVENTTVKNILQAISYLKKKKIGALIVIQKRDNLTGLIESGVKLNAEVDPNLIISLFNKHSLLHDGAMIFSGNRLIAGACYIPNLSDSKIESSKMGSRHRAALGLSEQSDAFIIVVSEETGAISTFCEQELKSNLSAEKLKQCIIKNFLINK